MFTETHELLLLGCQLIVQCLMLVMRTFYCPSRLPEPDRLACCIPQSQSTGDGADLQVIV